MADDFKIDKDGYILDGAYAGKHVSTIVKYAQGLEDALKKAGGTPPTPPKSEKRTPEEELEHHASGRVDQATLLTAHRFLADDEREFRAKIGEEEWGKVKDEVLKVIKTLPVQTLLQRGVHQVVYLNLKSTDPEFQDRIFKKAEAPPPKKEETEEEKEAREEREAAAAEDEKTTKITSLEAELAKLKGAAPLVPGGAKPTSPTLPPPTSGSRSSKPAKPKLVANDKIRRAAREWGVPVETYLLKMEAQGVTQDQLDTMSVPKEETRRRTVFDRPTASQ